MGECWGQPELMFLYMMFSGSTNDVFTFLENTKRSQMVKCHAGGAKQQEALTTLGKWAEKRQMNVSMARAR